MKNFVSILFFLLSISFCTAQSGYGGSVTLKVTCNGKPLVGYTITGTINDIDIGARGTTDRNGVARLNTDPLPIPDVDIKGEIKCDNQNYTWEASGFVYWSTGQYGNDNYYHLKLDEVAEMMAQFTGLPVSGIFNSFGMNCPGAVGESSSTASTPPPPSSSSSSGSSGSSATSSGSGGSTTGSTHGTTITETEDLSNKTDQRGTAPTKTLEEHRAEGDAAWDARTAERDKERALEKAEDDAAWEKKKADRKAESDKDWDDWHAKQEATKAKQAADQKAFMDRAQSPEGQAESFQNSRNMTLNKIQKLNGKISQTEASLNSGKVKSSKRLDVEYDLEELKIEKKLKENKLAKTDAQIAKGNTTLNRTERAPFTAREKELEAILDQLGADRKAGKPVEVMSTTVVEPVKEVPVKVSAPTPVPEAKIEKVETVHKVVTVKEAPVKKEEPAAVVVPEVVKVTEPAKEENEFKEMSTNKLRTKRIDLKAKLTKKKMTAKLKKKSLTEDEMTLLQAEISELEKQFEMLRTELETRD